MAHYQKTRHIHAHTPRRFDGLAGRVRFSARGGNANPPRPGNMGVAQIVGRAVAGQQQGGQGGVLDHINGGGDPVQITGPAKA